ncbi:hypothetical protein [Paraflavitalea speifideaquila]|uniref:glycine-rich domain-containing protein n=1 Tax=Paraflavitalea speifideaquila TaxID=3076558 RepID=UPI0028E270C8|nr:hypothetical protein [Paraflavitalea speifideiaquila]
MIIDETLLWSKLESFSPNNPYDALSFSQRLAQENGWPPFFTDRVIFEYKRFLFLCTISPHPVTPSDEVDQAWHLHLVYTKSYWNDLCKDILGKDLHHTPTTGGPAERDKFISYYESTLQLYFDKFGQAPPDDIWPPSHKRFGTADFVRANTDTHWIVPKKPWHKNISGLALIAIGLIAAAVSSNPAFLFLFGISGLLVLAYTSNNRLRGEGGSGCGGGGGCGGGCGGGD